MNPNEPIESLEETPNKAPNNAPVPNNKPTGIDAPLTEIPSTVAPTDLNTQDIDRFGKENIPDLNFHPKLGVSDLNNIPKNDEFNNIGKIPNSTSEEIKPKPKISKSLFILILIILISALGFGIYYYLSFGNSKKGTVNLNSPELQLEDRVSLNIEEYATFKNISPSNCLLETENINSNKIGTYKFSISCGNDIYNGTVKVVDKKAPVLETKIVTLKVNDEVTAEDFVANCSDVSECKYTITEVNKLRSYTQTAGTYEINLQATDNYKNTVTVKTYLIVLENDLDWYLSCVSSSLKATEYEGTYLITDRIGFINQEDQIVFGNVVSREYNFIYNDKAEFLKLPTSFKEGEITINGITGTPSFDEKNLTIKIVKVLTSQEYQKDFQNTTLNTFEEFKNYYESTDKNYKCSLQKP